MYSNVLLVLLHTNIYCFRIPIIHCLCALHGLATAVAATAAAFAATAIAAAI